MYKKIVISVISDLVNDQRVQKTANTLYNHGYEVKLIGAARKHSAALPNFNFTTDRIKLIFQKGFLMYAEWNLRLFFLLFFQKADILLANDLDTLLPNFLHSKLRGKKIVYDSHEYFTEQEEVANRKYVKKVWTAVEGFVFPKLKNVYTVNDSIANIYKRKYNVDVKVIKNLPILLQEKEPNSEIKTLFEEKFDGKIILLTQGTGLNANRGIEELMQAVELLPENYVLVIIGKGLILETLKKKKTSDQIYFIDTVLPSELKWITRHAFLGFSLDKATCLNYEYSLPNKLFDFIAAKVPVIASNRIEVAKVVNQGIGLVLSDVNAATITTAVQSISLEKYEEMKAQLNDLTDQYTWGFQEKELIKIFNNIK